MSTHTISRQEEWQAIQGRVRQLLCQHGRHARENGDFYLVDQDFGTYEHKVLVFNHESLSPELLDAASLSLSECSREWRVSFIEATATGPRESRRQEFEFPSMDRS